MSTSDKTIGFKLARRSDRARRSALFFAAALTRSRFLRASASQDVFHRVITFMAGVLVDGFVDASHRNRCRPGPGVSGGIIHGVAEVDRAVVDAAKLLDNMQSRARRPAAIEGCKTNLIAIVRGVHNERISLPMPYRVALPQPDTGRNMLAPVQMNHAHLVQHFRH